MATQLVASSVEAAVPTINAADELKLAVARTSINQRSRVRRPFEGPAVGTPSAEYVLKLPVSGDVVDISSAVIRFAGVQPGQAGGGPCRFMDYAAAVMIYSCEIRLANGSVLTTLTDVGLKACVSHYLYSNPWAFGDPVRGIGNGPARTAWALAARNYELPLSVLLPGVEYWPAFAFGPLEFHIRLAAATQALESIAAVVTPTFTFNATQSFLETDIITLRAGHRANLESQIKRAFGGTLSIVLESYRTTKQNIGAAAAAVDIVSPIRTGSLKQILMISQPTATLNNINTLAKFEDYIQNNVVRYNAELDHVFIPPYEIQIAPAVDSYNAYAYSILSARVHDARGGQFGSAAGDTTRIGYLAFDGTDPSGVAKFILCIDTTRGDGAEPGLLSGTSTLNNASDTRLHITYGAAGSTVAATATVFMVHDIRLSVQLGNANDLLIEA